jgi:NTP pyrophosphatase (non-canonical NTP hydrolase)
MKRVNNFVNNITNLTIQHLNNISKEIDDWASGIFGTITDWNMYFERVNEELEELKQSLGDDSENEKEEFADVFILLLRAAYSRQIDIDKEIIKKFEKIKNRNWSSVENGIGYSIK